MENLNNFFACEKGCFTSKFSLIIPCAARVKGVRSRRFLLVKPPKRGSPAIPVVTAKALPRSINSAHLATLWRQSCLCYPSLLSASCTKVARHGLAISAQLVAQPVVQGLHGVKVQIGAPLGWILVVIEITPAGDGGAHAGVAASLDVAHVISHI